jgi:hypothetical protein
MDIIRRLAKTFGSRTKALEILYLLNDAKPVVRHGYYDEEMPAVREFCRSNKLFIEESPYKVVLTDVNKLLSEKGIKVELNDPRRGMRFVYISKDDYKANLANTFEFKNNHKELGLVLGYPLCCCEFFAKHFPVYSKLDNNYAEPALGASSGTKFQFYLNIMERDKDITLLNHFPHSFSCRESISIAKKNFEIIMKYEPKLAKFYEDSLRKVYRIHNRVFEFV